MNNKDNEILENIKERLSSFGFTPAEIIVKLAEAKQELRNAKDVTANEVDYWNKVYKPVAETKAFDKEEAITLLLWLRTDLEGLTNTNNEPMQWEPVSPIYSRVVSSFFNVDLGIKDYNPSKGLAIIGNTGTGKTASLLHCRSSFFRCKFINCLDLSLNVKKRGLTELDKYSTGSVLFDDLGTEREVNDYGTKSDPVQDLILSDVYSQFQKGKKPYFTSNLTGRQFFDRYDKRFVDRFKEMCNILVLSNETSFR